MDSITTIGTRFTIVVAMCISVTTLTAQTADVISEPQLTRELTSRVFGDDESWQWIGAIDNRPRPIVKSERRVLVGTWRSLNAPGEVFVSI